MMTERDDEMLERFLAAGRAEPRPDEALLARVMADAAETARRPVVAPASRRPGLWAAFVAMLGGWPSLTGMTAAAAAGVWVGFVSPDLIDGYLSTDSGYALSDFMPDLTDLAGGE
jgi:hypothetical protein